MTIESLTHLDTQRRRKIEAALRAIRQGSNSLVLFANAAESAVADNDDDAAESLAIVYSQIQAIENEAEKIRRELKSCPMKSHHFSCDCNGEGGDR